MSKRHRKKKTNVHATAMEQPPFARRRDDLVDIEGIDPTMERALNLIGVQEFSDFKKYTAETLARALKQTGLELDMTAETIDNQDWIGRAAALAVEKNTAVTASDEIKPALEEISGRTTLPAAPTAAGPEKKMPLTAVTRVEHASEQEPVSKTKPQQPDGDAKKQEKETPITAVSQADAGLQADAAQTLPTPPHQGANGWALRIQNVSFTPIEMPAGPNQPQAKLLRGEIDYKMTNAEASVVAKRMTLCAQVHAVDMATGEHKLLASQAERLQPRRTDYHARLEFAVPRIGRYRLDVVVFLPQPEPQIAFYEGPFLRVVA
jgi:predicted flap endonuclease-1-like 5' DNA nuclease